jgi:hypothetical protein
MRQFEYDGAAAVLEDVITKTARVEAELRARQLLVQVWASAGREEAAKEAAEALYERDPGYPLPDPDRLSPRIRSFFVEARRAARAKPPAELTVSARRTQQNVVLRMAARTEAIVDRAELFVRPEAEEPWRRVGDLERVRPNVYRAIVGPSDSLQYYGRLVSPSGHVVAEVGAPDAPVTWRDVMGLEASDAPSPVPWVVGGLAAAVVVGLAVGLGVARPFDDGLDVAGTVQLPLARGR